MAYNKNKKIFKNIAAIQKNKIKMAKEAAFLNSSIEESFNQQLLFLYSKEIKGNKDVEKVLNYIEGSNLDYSSVDRLQYDNLEADFRKHIDKESWDNAIELMTDIKNKTKGKYLEKQAINKLNLEISEVFNNNITKTGQDVKRFIFKKNTKNESKYNTQPGIDTINKVGNVLTKIMDPNASKQSSDELMQESIDNIFNLTSNNLGSVRQSIMSVKSAKDNLERTKNLVVFDLETFGGKESSSGITKSDRITEFSFIKSFVENGEKKVVNQTALMGFDRKTGNEYLYKIREAMKNGELESNSLLGVTARRLARYGDSTVEMKDGVAVLTSFPGDDFDDNVKLNMEQIKKGIDKLVSAYDQTGEHKFFSSEGAVLSIKKDVKQLIDNAVEIQKIFNDGNGVVAGYNHIKYDIPFLNKELQRYYHSGDKSIKEYMNNVFNVANGGTISLDPKGNGTILDMQSVVESATRAFGSNVVYGHNQEVINKSKMSPNRQEYIGEIYQRSMFENGSAEAHRADFDTEVLRRLIEGEIDNDELRATMNIPKTYKGSALDYMLEHLTVNGYDDNAGVLRNSEKIIFNPKEKNKMFFMLGDKDNASGALYRGTGHLDFSYNTKTGKYHFANNVAKTADGKVETDRFYRPMNKNAVYQVSNIKKIKTSDAFTKEMLETYNEYASSHLYALEFSAVSNNGTLSDLKHVKVFKTFEEMEAFLSSDMNVIGMINKNNEFEFKNGYEEKLKTIKGFGYNSEQKKYKNSKEIFDDYIKFVDEKVAKDNARRFIFDEDKSYDRVKDVLNFIENKNKSHKLKGLSSIELVNIESEAVVKATNGKPVKSIKKELDKMLLNTAGYTYKGKRNIYESTKYNVLNSIDFIEENKELITSIIDEIDKSDKYKTRQGRETRSRVFRDVLAEIADSHPGEGRVNELSVNQVKNTYDVEVKGIFNRRNTSVIKNGINDFEDVISINNINSKNAPYELLNSMINAHYGTDAKYMSNDSLLNAQKRMIEQFYKNASFDGDLSEVGKMISQEDFNPLTAAEIIVNKMRENKKQNAYSGIIKLKSNEALGSINRNVIDKESLVKTISKDKNYIKNLVKKHSNVQIINNDNYDLTSEIRNLISFEFDEVQEKIKRAYGSVEKGTIGGKELEAKKILYKNAKKELKNIMGDLFASAEQAGAEIQFDQKNKIYSLRQGNNIVELKLPTLKMDDNGVMYIRYGNQNIKLRHKINVDKDGVISLGTSINDQYKYSYKNGKTVFKNQRRVKQRMEEGTFELGQIADMFKINLQSLSEDSKMLTINSGDYYSNMTVDAKEFLTKGIYGIFGDKEKGEYEGLNRFKNKLLSSTFYNEKFAENFEKKFGKALNDKTLSPEVLFYIAREAPLMLKEVLSESGGDLSEIAKLIGISSKKQETETGIYSLGEQRGVVTVTDNLNNHARPVSGGSGNVYYTQLNKDSGRYIDKTIDIKAGPLITNRHADVLNSAIENGEEYITSSRGRTIYTGDIGLDAIVKYQFDEVIKNNTIGKNAEEKARITKEISDAYTIMRSNLSLFEQQKIMDPMAFEAMFGNNITASKKYFSTNLDLVSALNDLSKETDSKDFELRKRISDLIPEIKIDGGEVTYTSKKGKYVTRNDKVFEYKGFGGINEFSNSKLRSGVFNFEVENSKGIKLTDEEISKILSKNIDEIASAKASDSMTAVALNILEREGYSARFSVSDIDKITLPKLNSGSGEKSMTTLIYAKTGMFDKDIRNVFELIEKTIDDGSVKIVDNTVLTEDAVHAILDRYKGESNIDLMTLLKNFKGDTVEEKTESLLDRLAKEQMTFRNYLFGFGKLEGISAMSNDAIAKHKNIGMILENNLANATSVLGKYMGDGEEGYNKALEFVIDKINYVDEKGNSPFAVFKNSIISGLDGEEEITEKKYALKATKGKHNNINFEGLRFTDEEHSELDGKALNDLMLEIDKKIESLSNNKRRKEDKVYHREYFKMNPKTGQVELVTESFVGQALFVKDNQGRDIVIGNVVEDTFRFMKDPETQTDTDFRYIKAVRETRKREAEEIKLLEELNELKKDPNAKESQIKAKRKAIIKNKERIDELRKEASAYDVKLMRYTSNDERLLRSHNFDEAFVNRINAANKEFGKDMIEELKGLGLEELISKDENGVYYLDKKNKAITDSVYEPFIEKMRGLKTRKEGEQLLTKEMVESDEYKHLAGVYERVTSRGSELGVESAENIYKLRQAKDALLFNQIEGLSDSKSLDYMLDNGYSLKNIREIPIREEATSIEGAKGILDNSTIIDLGSRFDENERYIALPGLGKFIGKDDSVVKMDFQKKVRALQSAISDYDKFANDEVSTIDGVTIDEARQRVLNISDEIKTLLGDNLLSKKGVISQYGVSEMPMATVRQKITGSASIYPNEYKLFEDKSNLDEILNSNEKHALNKATINGKSLLDWEKEGVHYDYEFNSEDFFRSMGLFDKDTLEKANLTEDEMRELLQTHGVSTLSIRYPEIYDSSLINTRAYLDPTIGSNATRQSVSTMLKYNADSDGDSRSAMLLESKSGMNSVIYKKYKDMNLDEESLIKQLESDGYSYKDDYMLFKQAEMKASVDAITENKFWYDKAKEIHEKDYSKNVKSNVLDLDNTNYKMKITNLIDGKKMKKVDNVVDNMINDALDIINNLDESTVTDEKFLKKYNDLVKFSKHVQERTAGEIGKEYGKKISVSEMSNPTKLMDSALSLIKNYGNLDEESVYTKDKTLADLVSEKGNYSIATNVRKMYNEALIEQNNKTGAGAIGSVNVKLVPLKELSRAVFNDGTESSYRKDYVINEVAAKIEQGAISVKKQEATGTQDSVIRINKALDTLIKDDLTEGSQLLNNWFDSTTYEDAFKDIFDNIYKSSNEKEQARMKEIIKNRVEKNGTSKDAEKTNYIREMFVDAINEMSNDSRAKTYLSRPIGSSNKNRSNTFRVVAMNEGQTGDVLHDVIGADVYDKLEEIQEAQKISARKAQRVREYASNISVESNARTAKSMARESAGAAEKILSHRSSGLALGVVGLAAGLLVSGFASGNPLQQDESPYLSDSNNKKPESIPEFFENEGGYVQQNNNGGYIINVRADTKQGKKQLERTMKKITKKGFGNVNVNMSIRDKSKPMSNQDVQNWITNNL